MSKTHRRHHKLSCEKKLRDGTQKHNPDLCRENKFWRMVTRKRYRQKCKLLIEDNDSAMPKDPRTTGWFTY